MLYTLLKVVHVTSIAVWFGGLVTMTLLNRLFVGLGDTATVQAIGRQGGRLSSRLFLPAVLTTLITGIGMVQAGDLSFGAPWIVIGMTGLFISMFIGAVLTGGAARKLAGQIAGGELDGPGIARAQRRILAAAIVNMLLLLVIIWAMVAKPS